VSYDYEIKTTFTNPSDWNSVKVAVGAGPSLIINGQVTADGVAEGFTEAKINTNRAGRSFVGATGDGRVIIGTMASATLAEAAAACKELGLVNAMCLDGGGSVALSYEGRAIASGRNVNNALAFVSNAPASSAAAPNPPAGGGQSAAAGEQRMSVDGEEVTVRAYNIGGNNYFKLRDIAYILAGTQKQFAVDWDGAANAIALTTGAPYAPVGGELENDGAGSVTPIPTASKVLRDGSELALTAYNIAGSNYFKLRDIGEAFDFEIDWDSAANMIVIDTSAGYTAD
jgi:hypothetical protein